MINPKGSEPFPFDALLHTYLSIGRDNISAVRVHGLRGLTYIDKTAGGERRVQEEEELAIAGETDRAYVGAPKEVVISGVALPSAADAAEGAGGAGSGSGAAAAVRRLTVHAHAGVREAGGLRSGVLHAPLDVVVWNAWVDRAKAIADLGDEDWRHYLCVEPGKVTPETNAAAAHATLAGGKSWTIQQQIVAHRD